MVYTPSMMQHSELRGGPASEFPLENQEVSRSSEPVGNDFTHGSRRSTA